MAEDELRGTVPVGPLGFAELVVGRTAVGFIDDAAAATKLGALLRLCSSYSNSAQVRSPSA